MVTVDKTREQRTFPDVEVVFDHVTGAGDFVEFEFAGDATDIEAMTECRPGGFTADDTDPPGAGRLQSSRPAPRSGALMSPVPGVPSTSP